jgi:hypothetical protein
VSGLEEEGGGISQADEGRGAEVGLPDRSVVVVVVNPFAHFGIGQCFVRIVVAVCLRSSLLTANC